MMKASSIGIMQNIKNDPNVPSSSSIYGEIIIPKITLLINAIL